MRFESRVDYVYSVAKHVRNENLKTLRKLENIVHS